MGHCMVSVSLTPQIYDVEAFLSHCHRRRYPAKSVIIYAGDTSDALYYIISGSVTVLVEDSSGHEIIVAYLNKGDFFGEMGLFEDAGHAPRSAWVKAKGVCEVAEISYTKFFEISDEHPDILFAMGKQLAHRLRITTQKVSDLAFLDVTGRIARALLDLCKEPDAQSHQDGMLVRVTRQEIGRLVGCSREMVGRVLKSLEDQHLISMRGKSIVVHGK